MSFWIAIECIYCGRKTGCRADDVVLEYRDQIFRSPVSSQPGDKMSVYATVHKQNYVLGKIGTKYCEEKHNSRNIIKYYIYIYMYMRGIYKVKNVLPYKDIY